jgi:hypothetical protein
MSEPHTNSPFHQAVQPAPRLEGNALAEAIAWARMTPEQRYARAGTYCTDWRSDPNIVHVSDGNGGTIYKDRATGQVLDVHAIEASRRM